MATNRDKYKKLDITEVEFPPLAYNYRKLTPMRDFVHVQLDRSPDVIKFEDGRDPIILSGSYKAQCKVSQAKVLALGPDVKEIEIGQTVIIAQHEGSDNDGRVRKDGTMLIQREHVLCVVES